MLWPTGLQFSGVDGSYCGVIYGELGEDLSKTPPIGLEKNGTLARKKS